MRRSGKGFGLDPAYAVRTGLRTHSSLKVLLTTLDWLSIGASLSGLPSGKVAYSPNAAACLWLVGDMTTTLEINPVSRQVLMHQAKASGNNDSDLACRTRLEGIVKGDIEKLTDTGERAGTALRSAAT